MIQKIHSKSFVKRAVALALTLMMICAAGVNTVSAAKKQTEKLIHKVISEMPEPDRTIFLLRFFYFYKIREIAEQLGMAEDAVESKIRRGKEKLKKTLIERGFFYEG